MTDTNTYDIQLFENTEFGKLTTIIFDKEQIYFIAKEIIELLGYKNYKKTLHDHVDTEDRLLMTKSEFSKVTTTVTLESIPNRGLTCINESAVYSLILSSPLPSAKRFKRWVTSEVLPTIRKHGAYMTEETLEKALTNPDFLIQLATKLKDEQEKNRLLTQENRQLALTNAALAKETNTWDHRKILDALIKKYAFRCLNGDIGWGYNKFIYTFDKKMGTKLRGRKDENGKQYSSGMRAIRTDELPSALGIIVALCIAGGINLEWAIGKDNVEMLEQMGIETE